ncbi:MAG: type II toxin-antitoxin system HicB family antitoxin [Bacteroides sp.]|nr:type II toxin-antitoxin system HicB family antitoxin [Eubacterium sp.]MCM1419445.1 type II toxin-antitoxin system HicB family antitoxin [Roseburia sp.]MCM1463287.1 type II toxin-antitoxin system HicB family antitoxin [Bacteroides sp.]
MKLTYPICLYPNDNGYTVIVPDLNGCVTEGKDLSDAIYMAIDAASLWVLDELEEGRKPPAASDPLEIKADEYEGGIVSVILLDMDEYAEKYGKKAIRKNCTIPAWLNTAAEARHINFSATLQSALIKEINGDRQ